MIRNERPVSAVPAWIGCLLVAALVVQLATASLRGSAASTAKDLPPAPSTQALFLASLGEPQAFARVAMLYVQGFDLGASNALAYRKLDYHNLLAWLDAILQLDPRSGYPLFSAARVYAENPDPASSRMALEFVHRAFLRDPNRRWPYLAHAALLAKHRLKDLPLARAYASALSREATAADLPLWAKQMEIFVLEDMNELEAAKTLLGGLLESGALHDPAEARFLAGRLKALEARLGTAQ